jgi:hypothetical protein
MQDARVEELAREQFNRISRTQLRELGLSDDAIAHRVARGRLIVLHEGVFALPPVLDHDDLGRWKGATLTAPGSRLSLGSAGHAWAIWYRPTGLISVTRPGSGGPRRMSGVIAYRSTTVVAESTELDGIPITTPERTLLDLARKASRAALARGVRDAIRLGLTTLPDLAAFTMVRRRRGGARALEIVLGRYSGLPLHRARSGAEVKALELLRDASRPMPRLNARIAGEEADLSWPEIKLIVEIDGDPYHLDKGEDARKEAAWIAAGWVVRRIPADDVYQRSARLLAITPEGVQR